jgi:hypothetical protein
MADECNFSGTAHKRSESAVLAAKACSKPDRGLQHHMNLTQARNGYSCDT